MLLTNVHYIIEAHFDMTDKAAPGDNPGKFQDILKRRIERGQCYHQPYFGCREFPAHFAPCQDIPPCPEELRGERDLGYMLYDMNYTDPEDIRPLFFRAVLRDGVLEVPPRNSEEVKG
jgi:CRISPR-associated protein Cas5d